MKKNVLEIFLDKLLGFPLWVKQIVYLRLYKDLAKYLSEDIIQAKEEDIFHLFVPLMTFGGKTELAERKGGYDPNFYTFLACIDQGLNMLEISMNNFWTMEEVSRYYVTGLEHDLFKPSHSVFVDSMAGFMSGKFRTGEYFKRINKINVDQLEQTIIKQKEYAQSGNPMKMAEIMISLGYITEKDVSSILTLKEEAKKRFILDASVVPHASTEPVVKNESASDEKVAKLLEENAKLKDQLRKILAFVKKNG